MDNRGGTSIEELMRNGQNSNMSEDDEVVNSILNEINADKEQMMNNQQQQQQQQQQMAQQQMAQQQMAQQQQQQMERIKQQQIQEQMMMQKQMEIQKMREKENNNNDEINVCENISLLDEFKSSIIFFIIFMLLNLTQINNLICGALSIENNNIFILLKTFVATVIFFFINKIVHKYI
jgi:hypothetical protein